MGKGIVKNKRKRIRVKQLFFYMKRFCFLLCFCITLNSCGQTINLDKFSKPGVIVCSSTRIKRSQEVCFILPNEILLGKLNSRLNLFITEKRVNKIDPKLSSYFRKLTADSVSRLVQNKFLKPEGADVYYEYLIIFTKSTGKKIFELSYQNNPELFFKDLYVELHEKIKSVISTSLNKAQ